MSTGPMYLLLNKWPSGHNRASNIVLYLALGACHTWYIYQKGMEPVICYNLKRINVSENGAIINSGVDRFAVDYSEVETTQ